MAKAPHKRTTVRIGGDVTGPFVVGDENTVTAQHDRSATDTPVAPHPVHRPAAGRRPAYRTLLATDIAHSAGRGDVAATEIRRVLRTALRESFTQSGITWDDCLVTDLGDGFSIAAPSDTSNIALLYPLLTELANRLRTHNRTAGDLTQIKVRAALHAGDITVDDTGVPTGRPLEVLARLLDAAPLRAALENTRNPPPWPPTCPTTSTRRPCPTATPASIPRTSTSTRSPPRSIRQTRGSTFPAVQPRCTHPPTTDNAHISPTGHLARTTPGPASCPGSTKLEVPGLVAAERRAGMSGVQEILGHARINHGAVRARRLVAGLSDCWVAGWLRSAVTC